MNKIGTVFKFETIRQLKKPSFWIMLLLLPLGIAVMMGLSALNSTSIEDSITNTNLSDKKIGLTDEPGLLAQVQTGFEQVESESVGREKVHNGELDVY